VFSLSSSVFYYVRFMSFTKFSVQISLNLVKNLLHKLIRAPMGWFDITPLGRITSRFTKDVDIVDYWISTTI